MVPLEELIQLLRTKGKGGDYLAGQERFCLAIDNALLHEFHHTIGKHLGVNTQIFAVVQVVENGIGDSPNTKL